MRSHCVLCASCLLCVWFCEMWHAARAVHELYMNLKIDAWCVYVCCMCVVGFWLECVWLCMQLCTNVERICTNVYDMRMIGKCFCMCCVCVCLILNVLVIVKWFSALAYDAFLLFCIVACVSAKAMHVYTFLMRFRMLILNVLCCLSYVVRFFSYAFCTIFWLSDVVLRPCLLCS